jgi:hypothetical protein
VLVLDEVGERSAPRVDPAPDAATTGPGAAHTSVRRPRSQVRDRYALGVAGLLAVQGLLTAWVASHSFFFADDLLYGSILTTEPLSLELLTRSWFGHLVPGFIALDWAFLHTFGLSWTAATAVIVAVQLAGTLAVIRLLGAIRGRSWTNLGVAAVVGLSLSVTTQSLWWGAVVTNLIPLAASVATLGCFVRWVRRGRVHHLLAMAVMFGTAVAFYEKSVLTAAYVGLLSLLVLDAGLPWRERWANTLRRWPAWLVLALVAGADLGVYLTGEYMVEAGPAPGLRQLGGFLLLSFPEGLVPSLFGFQPGALPAGLGPLVLLVANAVVLAVVVLSSLRSRAALQAWLFFGLAYLLNQGVLGRGRVSMLGVHMGTVLRYQLENVVLFGIALSVALPVLVDAARRTAPAGRRWRWAGATVVVALVAGVALPWTHSLRAEMTYSAGAAARSYVDTLRTSYAVQQERDPGLGFLRGDIVPNWVLYGAMAPFNRFDRVLPQVIPDVPFVADATRVLTVSEDGTVRPAEFSSIADAPVDGVCLAGAGEQTTHTVRLMQPLPEGLWSVRLAYRADSAGTATVTVDNDVPGPDLRMAAEGHAVDPAGTQLVAVAGSLAVSKVTVQFTGPGRLCLDSLQLGTFEPA